MASIDEFVKVGFTIEKATSLAKFFSNVGYLCIPTDGDFVEGYSKPENKVINIATIDSLKKIFKASSKIYKDIETLLMQKTNLVPNKSGVNEVIVYIATKQEMDDYGTLVDEFISVEANFGRLTIDSRKAEDIEKAAAKAQANDRRFLAQTSEETISTKGEDNIVDKLAKANYDLVDIDFHKDDNEALGCADVSVATQELLGSVGDLYSTFTNVTPQQYTDTEESNFKTLNVSYYTTVNAINGGGSVDEYGKNFLLGGYTVTGEDRKRRDIRFYFEKVMKARSLDFLGKKLPYEDASANILISMLTAILQEGQRNNLIVQDSTVQDGDEIITTKGFQIRPIYPSVLRTSEPTAYAAKKYKVVGYYRDAVTGREVEVGLYVDPADYEVANIIG